MRWLVFLAAAVAVAQPAPEQRALDHLATEVPRWKPENKCFSCHNNGDGARALYRARMKVPALEETTGWLADPKRWESKLARVQFAAAAAEAFAAGELTDIKKAAEALVEIQEKNGSWVVDQGTGLGSPVTYGTALATYLAKRTLEMAGFSRPAERAAQWFATNKPDSVMEAAAFLLAGAKPDGVEDLIRRAQTSDGGWGPREGMPSEVFDTALVLLATAGKPEWKADAGRGRAYLLRTQLSNGGWPETTRPAGAQSYAHHISTSAWATMALLATDSKRQ